MTRAPSSNVYGHYTKVMTNILSNGVIGTDKNSDNFFCVHPQVNKGGNHGGTIA
ncbi:hypothetical protein N007_00075 [Alicyclobacillus acidoterrestris ATCC 49025]|nr:hypothetical protein N007_00075 [Alicyclobacillus acidoterrestris ATCC 49025]